MVNRFAPRVQGESNFGAIAQATGSLLGSVVGQNSQTSRLYSQQKSSSGANRFAGRVNATGGWREMDQGLRSSLRSWESAGQAMGQSAGGALRDMFGGGSSGGSGGGGGGPFTNVNAIAGGNLADAQQYINASATANGIPANLLAAVIARESTGRWAQEGHRYVYLPDRGHNVLSYSGMTDPAVRRVGMDPRSLIGNQQGQIEAAARLIRQIADNEAKGYGWQGVANVFYSGDPTGRYTPGDSWQHGSTESYGNDIMRFWEILEPGGANAAGGSGSTGNQFGGISSMSTVWGGSGERDLSYGFNAPNNLGMYGYGTSYGMDGRGHTGVDIPMNIGETTYTPVSGTVVCACSGNGSGAEGNGCGAFSDVMGQGCGRIEVKLDNGHTVIFGHMSTSNVKVGQRVNAGQAIGGAGGMNGGHVHLEYRIPDPSTPSGWRIVDPTGFVSGTSVGASAAGAAGGMDQMPYNPNVPWQGWKGRQIGQTQFAQAGYRPVSSWRL